MTRLWLCVVLGLVALAARRGRKGFRPAPYPTITNRTFINQYLDAHNRLRSAVTPTASNMLYMTWDLALAKTARAWGQRCIFEHNHLRMKKGGGHPDPKFNPPGENIWYGNARRRPFNFTGAMNAWYSEVIFYNYQNNSCTQLCMDYFQLVWATTYKVGCAVVFCRKLDRHRNIENVVCNYGPPGNYRMRPYESGRPCSTCPEGDTCHNNLCRNPEREDENIKRYARWFPPWEHRIKCDEYCIAVAVLRPSVMLLAFGAVYYLQQRYRGLSLQT
ncbi:GLIPR1-like protein 1 [Elgaria multicarinata webbii]|uniref:GLIPR1-like protein 1 n=1 Tax=Elgaria multicarinata webbii TaxID=159646 RepID=UPI002FCD421A